MSGPTSTCPVCKRTLPLSSFYTGRGDCRECVRKKVKARYKVKRLQALAYAKRRAKLPERQKQLREATARYEARNPEKVKARKKVREAIRTGRLKRQACVVCGRFPAQAHHIDYSRPLFVVWACRNCHNVLFHGGILDNHA
jgi:ribosomal protein L37AE/L43A